MQFHFNKALEIFAKTFPFVLLRLAVYLLVFLGSALWFGGIYLLFVNWPFPAPAWLAWVFGGIAYSGLAKLVRNYLLYLLKAAHIAVITRLVISGELPSGSHQLLYGKDLVFRQFVQVSIFFLLDRLVNTVLKAFNRTVFRMIRFVPGAGALKGFSRRLLDYSVGYIDEAVLSYTMVNPDNNPWQMARKGLVLYVQNWKTVLSVGFVLALTSYVLVAVVAAPGVLFALTLAPPLKAMAIAASLALGTFIKFAVMDPFALTSIIVHFHRETAGQQVDWSLEHRLEEVSGKFREIKDRARDWSSPITEPAAAGPIEIP